MTPVLAAVRSLRLRTLQLNGTPPDQADSPEVQGLCDLYRFVKDNLPDAIEEERKARSQWYQAVLQSLGADNKVVTLVNGLRGLIDSVVAQGVGTGLARSQLSDLLAELKPNSLDVAAGHGAAIATVNSTEILVRSAIIGTNAATLSGLLERADNFIRAIDLSVDNQRDEAEQRAGAGLADSEAVIAAALDGIAQALDAAVQLPRNDYEPA
jgi:hypothetical protein